MKKNKIVKILGGAVLVFSAFSLNSCLKNGQYYTDFSSPAASIDLPLAAAHSNAVVPFAFDASLQTATIPIYVNVASPSIPNTANTATLAVDTAYLSQYNINNSTDYEPMPDSVYNLSKMDLNIPAGQRLDSAVATFLIPKIDLAHSYVLSLTIKDASLPIEQWNHLLLYIAVKNKYDGVYTVTGTMVDVTTSTLTGYYPWTVQLVTSGPSSDYVNDPTNGPIHLIVSGGTSLSYYGGFGVVFNFNPANDNIASVVNYYGNPSSAGNTRAGSIDMSHTYHWDDATHNFDVVYYMTQPNTVTTAPYIRTIFTEHYEYIGPR